MLATVFLLNARWIREEQQVRDVLPMTAIVHQTDDHVWSNRDDAVVTMVIDLPSQKTTNAGSSNTLSASETRTELNPVEVFDLEYRTRQTGRQLPNLWRIRRQVIWSHHEDALSLAVDATDGGAEAHDRLVDRSQQLLSHRDLLLRATQGFQKLLVRDSRVIGEPPHEACVRAHMTKW